MINDKKENKALVFLTLAGISIFILFFMIAAAHYPGGSNFNSTSVGYSWKENFWCELLAQSAKNTMPNSSRPYALTGMIGLTVGVSAFWLLVTQDLFRNTLIKISVRSCGILSMILSSFIFTNYHDLFIFGSVISGSIAFILLFNELWQRNLIVPFITGNTFLILIFTNCFIYLTDIGGSWLPSLQKMTFLYTLTWISYISMNYQKLRNES